MMEIGNMGEGAFLDSPSSCHVTGACDLLWGLEGRGSSASSHVGYGNLPGQASWEGNLSTPSSERVRTG